MRLLEQAVQMILRIAFQREEGRFDEASQSVIDGIERLFGLTIAQIGALDEDQLFAQLTLEENAGNARDKCLVFAALNNQAALAYEERDLPALAQPAFHVALIFTLRALTAFSRSDPPSYTPGVDALLFKLEGFELPPSTLELLKKYRTGGAS